MSYRQDMFWLLGLFVVLMLVPSIVPNNYYLTILILGCLHAMITVGLCLLVGHAGQISLGHAGFYGLAAYTSAYLSTTWGWPVEFSMLTGVGLTILVSLLLGLPCLKLQGHYLAMATLGFGIILSILFTETVDVTGGPSGFVGIPGLSLAGWAVYDDVHFFRLLACLLCILAWLGFNILHSRFGRALRALNTSELGAQAMGVNVARYKLFIFVLSASFAAIAGVFYAHYLTFIAPASFGFMFSVELMVMVVLGGMLSIPGAIIGAFFITILPEFLRAFEDIEVILFGLILVLGMIFVPDGLAGGSARLWDWLKNKLVRGQNNA